MRISTLVIAAGFAALGTEAHGHALSCMIEGNPLIDNCLTITPPIGEWDTISVASLIDDSELVGVTTYSAPYIGGAYRQRVVSAMHIQCYQDQTQLAFYFGGALMESGPVTIRLGTEVAETRPAGALSNGQILGVEPGLPAINLIRRMFQHDRLVVRASAFIGSAPEVVFDISQLSAAITPVRGACHW